MKRRASDRRISRSTLIKLSIVACSLSAASTAHAQCSRATLEKITNAYVQAQSDGKPGKLPLSNGAMYFENDRPMEIGKGVMSEPLKPDFTRSFHDTVQCATFTELVAALVPHPYVIHTRIEASGNGKISKVEFRGDGRGRLDVRRRRAPGPHSQRKVG